MSGGDRRIVGERDRDTAELKGLVDVLHHRLIEALLLLGGRSAAEEGGDLALSYHGWGFPAAMKLAPA